MRNSTSNTYIKIFDMIDFPHKLNSKNNSMFSIRKLPKGPTLKLPVKLKLDKDLAWATGFYLSEGTKTKYCVGASNCEVDLILKFKEIINNKFKLKNIDWRAYIKTSKKDLRKVENIYKKLLKIKNIKVIYDKNAYQDNIEIRINNVPFASVFNKLVNVSLSKINYEKKLALYFLDGYEVGDGSIIVRNKCLHSISITVKEKKMKEFLSDLFLTIYKVRPNERRTKGAYELYFCDVKLMTEFILDYHFNSSKRQWKRLLESYLNKEYTRSHIRYWLAIRKNQLDIKKIVKIVKRSHWSIRSALNEDVRLGLVKLERKNIKNMRGYGFNFYSMTDKGNRLLKILGGW